MDNTASGLINSGDSVSDGGLGTCTTLKSWITADTALRLGRYFGTSAQFWPNLQNPFDLEVQQDKIGSRLGWFVVICFCLDVITRFCQPSHMKSLRHPV
jgi:hypothetical protein